MRANRWKPWHSDQVNQGETIAGKAPPGLFHTTHWSVVLRASGSAPDQFQALEELCRTYWPSLFGFLRSEGRSPQEAEDLVQGFFERFLAHDYLRGVNPDKGRFRSFLLACLRHYSANVRRDGLAQRRGGRIVHLDINEPGVSARCEAAVQSEPGPEMVFDRIWAETLMHNAAQRLRSEFVNSGRGELYEKIRVWLASEPRAGEYASVSEVLRLTEGAVATAVHRMRQRYRQLVRAEVAHTVQSPDELADEMRYLLAVLTAV